MRRGLISQPLPAVGGRLAVWASAWNIKTDGAEGSPAPSTFFTLRPTPLPFSLPQSTRARP